MVVGEPLIRLVVSADDVGLHPGITAGAIEAHNSGIVTSASVLSATRHWPDTAAALAGAPTLGVGVHLTLCEGTPVLPREEVPSLVATDGRFPLSLRRVVARVLGGAARIGEVHREWEAQVRRVQEAGFVVGHIDGHKHIHALPRLSAVAAAVARRCGVPAIRIPRQPGAGPRRRVRGVLGALSVPLARKAGDAGLLAADRVVGIGHAGGLSGEQLVLLLEGLPPGLTELVAHPGLGQDQLRAEASSEGLHWTHGYEFEQELAALCSPAVSDVVRRRGIVLTSWQAEAAR